LEEAIDRAHAITGIEEIILATTVGHEQARALYLKVGFIPVAIDPRYLKIGERYFDSEWMQLRLSRERGDPRSTT
jgi:RimJ/RimL family protein N-acetyltransferase